MTDNVDREVPQESPEDAKPIYRRPMLVEIDVGETASGIIRGSPENSTYFVS